MMASIKCLTPINCVCRRWFHVNQALNCSRRLLDQVPEYKSIYSLDKVYPKSNLNSLAAIEIPKSKDEKFSGYIPVEKLKITRIRASKPGGQNVNKTNSKVVITFKLAEADWISGPVKEKLAELHKNQINKDGEWILRSEKTRTTSLNLADCLDKLRVYITEAEESIPPPPDPVTLEMRRERYERAAQERLRQKRHKSMMNRLKSWNYHATE